MTKRSEAMMLNKYLLRDRPVVVGYRLDGQTQTGRIIRARSRRTGDTTVLEGKVLGSGRWAEILHVIEP